MPKEGKEARESDLNLEETIWVCPRCGQRHRVLEPPPDEEETAASDNTVIWLSLVGIGILVLIWFWVFKWGVPLIKGLTK